jgi:sorting nexin-1/2
MLPSDLIDEDLLAASDPSLSLKKAFVKSTPAPRGQTQVQKDGLEKKAYVFTPAKAGPSPGKAKEKEPEPTAGDKKEEVVAQLPEKEKNGDQGKEAQNQETKMEENKAEAPSGSKADENASGPEQATQSSEQASREVSKTGPPESIPLPASAVPTPTTSRLPSPKPASPPPASALLSPVNDVFSPIPSSTPKHDRVAVSPLDPPVPSKPDYGFQALSIGGTTTNSNVGSASAGASVPQPPPKQVQTDWTQPSATSSRFAGKGWAAVDDADDLFGAGGPSIRSDPWGSGAGDGDGEGWAGDNVPVLGGSSQVSCDRFGIFDTS